MKMSRLKGKEFKKEDRKKIIGIANLFNVINKGHLELNNSVKIHVENLNKLAKETEEELNNIKLKEPYNLTKLCEYKMRLMVIQDGKFELLKDFGKYQQGREKKLQKF